MAISDVAPFFLDFAMEKDMGHGDDFHCPETDVVWWEKSFKVDFGSGGKRYRKNSGSRKLSPQNLYSSTLKMGTTPKRKKIDFVLKTTIFLGEPKCYSFWGGV